MESRNANRIAPKSKTADPVGSPLVASSRFRARKSNSLSPQPTNPNTATEASDQRNFESVPENSSSDKKAEGLSELPSGRQRLITGTKKQQEKLGECQAVRKKVEIP